jgi:hypothetical protein
VTVARFRKDFAGAVPALFAEVLALCARLGMGKVGVVALDGTKIAASASKAANRTEDGLVKMAQEMGAAHAAADEQEDALFGQDGRGDDDPGDPSTRQERVAAALASARAEREAREAGERAKADEHVRAAEAGTPKAGRPPAGAEVELARQHVAREEAAAQARWDAYAGAAAAGRKPAGGRPRRPEESGKVRAARERLAKALALAGWREETRDEKAPAEPVRRNVTDPGSRLMPVRGGGFIQGCNAQNLTSQDGLIIATRLTQDTTDTRWYQPMTSDAIKAAAAMAAAAGRQDAQVGLVLADAGYLSRANLTCHGPDRLIATGKHRTLEKAARDPSAATGHEEDSAITAMAARLATPGGITAYRQRGHIAETPHGNIKHNLRFRQLTMRGHRKASAEWAFVAAVHNLMTAITSGHLTRHALQDLAT